MNVSSCNYFSLAGKNIISLGVDFSQHAPTNLHLWCCLFFARSRCATSLLNEFLTSDSTNKKANSRAHCFYFTYLSLQHGQFGLFFSHKAKEWFKDFVHFPTQSAIISAPNHLLWFIVAALLHFDHQSRLSKAPYLNKLSIEQQQKEAARTSFNKSDRVLINLINLPS
jgi:hypothetical protein